MGLDPDFASGKWLVLVFADGRLTYSDRDELAWHWWPPSVWVNRRCACSGLHQRDLDVIDRRISRSLLPTPASSHRWSVDPAGVTVRESPSEIGRPRLPNRRLGPVPACHAVASPRHPEWSRVAGQPGRARDRGRSAIER